MAFKVVFAPEAQEQFIALYRYTEVQCMALIGTNPFKFPRLAV
jgi:hypothetical protein